MKRVALGTATIVVLLGSAALGATPAGHQSSADKVEPDLHERLETSPAGIPVFVLLTEQSGLDETSYRSRPDLDKGEWRRHAIERLRSVSDSSRERLLANLRAAGHAVVVERAFWIVNGMNLVADAGAVEWMAASSDVARIYLRTEKPEDLIATEGRFTRAFEQAAEGPVGIDQVLAHRDLSWNLEAVQADLVWSRLGYIGRGVVIAILDSGVNYRHSDFRHHLWRNEGEIERNDLDDDGNGYVDDIYGFNFANGNSDVSDDFFHGTSSASVMVGDGRGGMLTGVAPGAELMILRMYDQMTRHSNSRLWQAYQYDAWEAYEYAVSEGADVINMSFAWEPAEKPLHAAWRYASTNVVAAGVAMVAGAGNFRGSYPIPGQIRPPASVPAVIATGGIVTDGGVANLTSRGPVTWQDYPPFDDFPLPAGLTQVAFSAPWGEFPVTVFSGRGYQVMSLQRGSSLTSPHVAGVIALMLESDPELMPDEIRERLALTARDVGELGTDPYTGTGMVQAYDAIMVDSIARPRVVATRYVARGGDVATLRPGSEITVEIDVENPSPIHPPAVVDLLPDSSLLLVAEPRRLLDSLGFRQTLRFAVRIDSEAPRGSVLGMRLRTRLRPGGIRTTDLELPVWGGDVLLVDDDGGGQYEREWLGSLARLGERVDLLSNWPAPRAELPTLSRYRTVIWIAGEESHAVLTSEQIRALTNYAEDGGRLLVVGQSVARDLAGTDFLRLFGASFVSDVVRPRRIAGVDGTIMEGFETDFVSYPTLPDLVAPVDRGRALLRVPDEPNGTVAVGTGVAALVTFEIGSVTDQAHRDDLVRRLTRGH